MVDDTFSEFTYTEADFRRVQKIIGEHAGISLSDAKRSLVYNRLTKRLRLFGMSAFQQYLDYVDTHVEEEFSHFVNAITTNLTFFFREEHHFDFLKESELARLIERNHATKRIRIWSAGCSTGEEPYSLAITVKEAVPSNWDVKILATDLDFNVVNHGQEGVYDERRVEGMSKERLNRWFSRGSGENEKKVRVKQELQDLITFKQLNLMHEWPMKGPFDLIFCRNVMIYFNKETQSRLTDRYADYLIDDGHLIIGHSESLFKVTERFKLIGKTIYQKIS
ncbi:MAG: protein-glutamate O-methyltransferase [Gammaproteobacteria bacterium]|jgi:chemotaxis protein methyltransferase CheR|nr:protein-glutamate O-methyltransferase [Gammaproteobacteria bacterium]